MKNKTVKELLQTITQTLHPIIPRASREAQLLLMASLNVDELWLITNQNATVADAQTLMQWVGRRQKNEPLEYIINKVSFYSEEFFIAPGALIPRPETELLIDEASKYIQSLPSDLTIVEVGVGSGIISVMLAKKFPNAKIIAVDISQDALEIAQINVKKFGVESNVELRLGSLLEPIHEKIDYLISNPPYIQNGVELESNLDYEPQNALFGGDEGDEIIKELLDQVLNREIKYFSCEIGYDQKDKITAFLQNHKNLDFYKDLAGFDRGFTLRLVSE